MKTFFSVCSMLAALNLGSLAVGEVNTRTDLRNSQRQTTSPAIPTTPRVNTAPQSDLPTVDGNRFQAYPRAEAQTYYQRTPTRRITSVESEPIVAETSWWRPSHYQYEIGYEAAATNTTGVLGTSVITGGTWFDEKFGLDIFLGFTKSASTANESVSDVTNTLASPNSKVTTTTYTGASTPMTLALAFNPKYRLIQTDWFQLNIGLMAGVFLPSSSEYSTGTLTETYNNVSDLNTKTVVETGLGSVKSSNSLNIGVGPRITSQFYIKWFPHLAVGFSTGIFTFLSGNNTTTTDARSRTYTVSNGTAATPTADSTTHTVSNSKPGFRGTTFGLGGTTFAFTGNFTIRYVW